MSENSDIYTRVSKYDYGTYTNNTEKNKKKNFIEHHVQKDDTLTSIAIKYGVSTGALKQINNMFSNEITFIKIIKIPVSYDSNAILSSSDEGVQHFEKPDLIKDYLKTNHSHKEVDNVDSNNSFLNKMDQEILKAKSNLDKLHRRSLLRDSQFTTMAQSYSATSLSDQTQSKKSNQSKPDVRIKMPQESFQNCRYPHYNATFKDNFFDL